MSILIDGYNLLHVTGVFGRRGGHGSLERSRHALLNALAASLPHDRLRKTTVVFDAHQAPPGLPRVVDHRGLAVLYAKDHADADALLEELIARHHAPRHLTVVSSDHRVQRAARRRRATAVDSDVWYAQLLRERRERSQPVAPPAKPSGPPSVAEVEYWLAEFGSDEPAQTESDSITESARPPDAQDETTSPRGQPNPLSNPFPPGYGEEAPE